MLTSRFFVGTSLMQLRGEHILSKGLPGTVWVFETSSFYSRLFEGESISWGRFNLYDVEVILGMLILGQKSEWLLGKSELGSVCL